MKNLTGKLFENDITATFDLETTGTNVEKDRIVQICITKRYPDDRIIQKTFYINPEMEIPIGASSVHGITNEMVQSCKTFEQMAGVLFETLKECTLIGFNSDSFDVILLSNEFRRCGIQFPLPNQNKIDVRSLYLKLYPNTLSGIYQRLIGKPMENAHDATADVNATDEILSYIISNNDELKGKSASDIDKFINGDERYLDLSKNILINKYGQYVWNKGKHAGRAILDEDKEIVDYNNFVINKSIYHTQEVKEYLKMIISRTI